MIFKIKYILSPQSNGDCEVLYKEIKNFLLDDYENNKENLDIEISIVNESKYHNKEFHNATKFEPNYFRNIKVQVIINNVFKNIINSMKRKVYKFKKYNAFIKSKYYT